MQDYMKFLASREPAQKPPIRHDSISEPTLYPPVLPTIADILPILDGNAHNEEKLPDPLPIRDKGTRSKKKKKRKKKKNLFILFILILQ